MAVDLRKFTGSPFPIPGQLMLPAPLVVLMLTGPKVNLTKTPKPRTPKPKKVTPPPKKFSSSIKLYWTEFGDKDERLIEIHDPETYAAFEILHGIYELEGFERWQNHPQFDSFYQSITDKVDVYVNRIKRLYKLHTDKWDWDWVN